MDSACASWPASSGLGGDRDQRYFTLLRISDFSHAFHAARPSQKARWKSAKCPQRPAARLTCARPPGTTAATSPDAHFWDPYEINADQRRGLPHTLYQDPGWETTSDNPFWRSQNADTYWSQEQDALNDYSVRYGMPPRFGVPKVYPGEKQSYIGQGNYTEGLDQIRPGLNNMDFYNQLQAEMKALDANRGNEEE